MQLSTPNNLKPFASQEAFKEDNDDKNIKKSESTLKFYIISQEVTI